MGEGLGEGWERARWRSEHRGDGEAVDGAAREGIGVSEWERGERGKESGRERVRERV